MDTEITRWNPANELNRMQRFMDRFWYGLPQVAREDVEFSAFDELLPVDIFDQDGNVVVKAALPGIRPDEIDVKVSDGMLHIQAETHAEEDVERSDYYRQEYRYGKISRSFRLPPGLDTNRVTARYDNGMLRLTFPRTEAAKGKSIQVQVK